MEPTYWLDLFTHQTWQEFLAAGANVSGFRENRWNTVEKGRRYPPLLSHRRFALDRAAGGDRSGVQGRDAHMVDERVPGPHPREAAGKA